MSTLKILLADADEDSRIALEQDLEQERSLEVVGSTGDGMDAIKLIEKTDLDIIIMDLVLAGVDGLEVLEQMSQMERKRPMVIVYSAYIRGSVRGGLFYHEALLQSAGGGTHPPALPGQSSGTGQQRAPGDPGDFGHPRDRRPGPHQGLSVSAGSHHHCCGRHGSHQRSDQGALPGGGAAL